MGAADDQRSIATSSTGDASGPPSESPYAGPLGPSFPYQMYPQNVRPARTLSVTTASTDPASDESYAGPRGPAHPYGLYPQTTAAAPTAAIPVGFPRHGRPPYQRQIGPEGEEIADMIGPDGHTEQLPPYSRYPDEAYARKSDLDREALAPAPGQAGAAVVAVPFPAAVSTVPTTTTAVAAAAAAVAAATIATPSRPPGARHDARGRAADTGAGGLGLAARKPRVRTRQTTPTRLGRATPSRSFTASSEASQHDINTAAREVSEKQRPLIVVAGDGAEETVRHRPLLGHLPAHHRPAADGHNIGRRHWRISTRSTRRAPPDVDR